MRSILLSSVGCAALTLASAASAAVPVQNSAAPTQTTTAAVDPAAADSDAAQASPQSAASPVAPDAADTTNGLQEIVVTAQRRSENLQRAAVAVAVVSGDALTNSAITSPAQLGVIVPALTVQQGGGANTTFFVRGVGNFTVNGYTDPAIAFNYDGVYVGRPTSTSGTLFDLERVEVLKGPQGTLYGRNATSGAINVIPARPRAGELSAYATASYGNYDALIVQGAVNLPMGEDGALRISGNYSSHDPYLADGLSDEKMGSVRVQMLGKLTPDLTVRIAGDYAHVGGKGVGSNYAGSYQYNAATQQYGFTPANIDPSQGLYTPASQAYRTTRFAPLTGRTLTALDSNIYQGNDYYGANAEIEYRSPIGTLTIVPAFRSARLDNRFAAPGFVGYIQENDSQYSVEARLGGKAGIFDYIVGGFYFDEQVKGNYTFAQSVLNAYQDFVTTTESYAAFGRLTANLTDKFRLVGGLRYTNDTKDFLGQADVVSAVCTVRVAGVPSCPSAPLLPVTDTVGQLPFAVPAIGGAPIPLTGTGAIVARVRTPVDQTLKFDKITYRAAAEYDLGPRSLLYASFETGYRSGGFALAAGYETYQPEFIDAYTIGSKNRLFGNRLQLNIEAFVWKYRNQQIFHPGIDRNGNQGQFTDNAGRSTNKGIEIDGQLLVTPTTLLSANVQYLDAKFDSFVYQVPVGTAPPYVGCATSISATTPTLRNVDCSGNRAYQSPRWTVNLGGQQTIPFGDYKLVLQADTQYRTERYVGFNQTAVDLVGPTWQSNAMVTVGPRSEDWSLSAFVRNIEDDRYATSAQTFAAASLYTYITAPPRTYGLRANVKFR